jgi:hypothetical protein
MKMENWIYTFRKNLKDINKEMQYVGVDNKLLGRGVNVLQKQRRMTNKLTDEYFKFNP